MLKVFHNITITSILLLVLAAVGGCYGDAAAVNHLTADANTNSDHFATLVVDYKPAPGQFLSNFSSPAAALGPPDGGIVSLGSFGGSITLKLARPVTDIPGEADLVIWGNAFYYSGNPRHRWAEPGLVELSSDGSNWVFIGGSLFNSSNPPADSRTQITYYQSNHAYWPAWAAHTNTISRECYNLGTAFSSRVDPGTAWCYTNGAAATVESLYGYADCTPRNPAGEDLLAPDDPLAFGNSGSGGDVIFLEWALNASGSNVYESIRNKELSYLRITTGIHYSNAELGEFSTEIDAVGVFR